MASAASKEEKKGGKARLAPNKLIAIIGDEETCVGFLLAGIGHKDKLATNFLVVGEETVPEEIEERFRTFLKRTDVAIILINQHVADMIRPVVDSHEASLPAILEIPSKDHPYDSQKDSIMKRAYKLISPDADWE